MKVYVVMQEKILRVRIGNATRDYENIDALCGFLSKKGAEKYVRNYEARSDFGGPEDATDISIDDSGRFPVKSWKVIDGEDVFEYYLGIKEVRLSI